MQQYQSLWLVTSNLAWVLPAFYAYTASSLLLAVPSLVIMVLSVQFHIAPSRLREWFDTGAALCYLALGPVLLLLAPLRPVPLLACLTLVAVTLLVWWYARCLDRRGEVERYRRWHGSWHVLAAVMTLAIYRYSLAESIG